MAPIDDPSDVLRRLRESLTVARDHHEPFDRAWPASLSEALAGASRYRASEWVEPLAWSRPMWESSYYRD